MSDNTPLSSHGQIRPLGISSETVERTNTDNSNPMIEITNQCTSKSVSDDVKVNALVESVFYITLNKEVYDASNNRNVDAPEHLVYLEELATSLFPRISIDLETLEQALFERLLLTEPTASVIPNDTKNFSEQIVETKVISYLYNAHQNLLTYSNRKDDSDVIRTIRSLIFRNAVTALKQPDLFDDQNLTKQVLELLKEPDKAALNFLDDIVNEFMSEDDPDASLQLKRLFTTIIKHLTTKINEATLINLDLYVLPSVQFFAGNRYLALILLEACQPVKKNGYAYQETLLGALLALSPLPRRPTMPPSFFENPTDQGSVNMTEQSLWTGMKHVCDHLKNVFLTLLRGGGETRNGILDWIGGCLRANVSRGKLWYIQTGNVSFESMNYVSDGFMVNLGAVLLRLSQPFCTSPNDPKSLKIDPTYCAVQESEAEQKSVHVAFLHEETCLVPAPEDSSGNVLPRSTATTYNFVTECFFMTQKCLDLGYRVVVEKLSRLSQDLSRTDQALSDPQTNRLEANVVDLLRKKMQIDMANFTSLRCAILEPSSLAILEQFQAMMCYWLVQVATHPVQNQEIKECYAPTNEVPVHFPISVSTPTTLSCVPEFIIENIIRFVSFSRRIATVANHSNNLSIGESHLSPLLTMVVVFMGSADRMRNPHLRAGLAECLESMLPTSQDDAGRSNSLNIFFRERLFKEHPHRLEIARSLLDVFVGIEMTGQSVQFEQKFNYRRPMYLVMDYLWEIDEHKQCFIRLAEEAEANMEAVQPPLFLRFVNLLINDAIFLLDEALSNMSQIRKLQAERDSGAWDSLANNERSTRNTTLLHTSQMARFDNILGRDTGRALRCVARDAPGLLSRPTLAPRIASMLNYFLQQLVGPNRTNFKVRDSKDLEFDPASTVMDICHMYVTLVGSDEFCLAVSDDGRSYSPQLFTLAEEVLAKIGGGPLIGDLRHVAERVRMLAAQRLHDEEALTEAPEEFLDPIMSTLMSDPVILPSSRTTVDRATIARHLLSDQSDPFNRSPLTMDQIIPNIDLKQKIEAWIKQRRQETSGIYGSSSTDTQNI